MTVRFYLGVPEPSWRVQVPTFVSARRLRRRVSAWPAHPGPWAVDSGGFTELNRTGRWETSATQYVEELLRWSAARGQPDWAAPQDYMCEPQILARTGLTIAEHQARTVASVVQLREHLAGAVHVIPVLQGWEVQDYVACIRRYEAAGIDLRAERVVGVGTVCRRQHTTAGNKIIQTLHSFGYKLHGFGYKITGLRAVADLLHSADSMAWSVDARWSDPLPGCRHKNCANCVRYALRWRTRLLASLPKQQPRQLTLADHWRDDHDRPR